jgi:hypothetical protein
MSVEQKIREVIAMAKDYHMAGTSKGYSGMTIDEATQSILQIIESDVIGGKSWHTCYDSSKCNRDCKGMIENDLRAEQRANLREYK